MSDHFDSAISEAMGRDKKHTKSAADYSKGMMSAHCGICAHFLGSKPIANCTEVMGHVDSDMWCKYFKGMRK